MYKDGDAMHYALTRLMTRSTAYDCVMTCRFSEGLILSEFYTGRGKVAVRDLEISALDADKSIGVIIKQDGKI